MSIKIKETSRQNNAIKIKLFSTVRDLEIFKMVDSGFIRTVKI